MLRDCYQRLAYSWSHVVAQLQNPMWHVAKCFIGSDPPPRDALEGGEAAPTPPPSRAPSLCPATVSLTPSASFNGIYNRQ